MGMRAAVTEQDAAEAKWAWSLAVAIGIASLVAGAILVFKPSDSLATLAVVVGIFLLLDGIIELVESFGHSVENRGLAAGTDRATRDRRGHCDHRRSTSGTRRWRYWPGSG